jgi:putative hydrolase of the HAD superfamily
MNEEFLGHDVAGVVLDAVGTLIEPVPAVALVYADAARRQGVGLDPALVKERFHRHFGADEVDELRGTLSTDEATEIRRWRRIVGQVLPELPDPERGFAELWSHFATPAAWRTFEDVAPALERLRGAGFGVCIASNFDTRLRKVLQGLPVPQFASAFPPLVISSEVGVRKPHPHFYRAAALTLGLEPGRVLCIGDDLENDVRGPWRAGLRACLIDRSGRAEGSVPSLLALVTALQHGALDDWGPACR